MGLVRNGPAVGVGSQTCDSPGSADSKAGSQFCLEQRGAHRTSLHNPDAGDTRSVSRVSFRRCSQTLARESVLRSADKPPLCWRMRRVRCLCWSWEAVTRGAVEALPKDEDRVRATRMVQVLKNEAPRNVRVQATQLQILESY
jgi:hypothetical protein